MTGYNQSTGASDPFEFVRNLWSGAGFPLPGMVTPTLDADELGKRISEMRSVENWLRMNLNMLQMTIQGLEMQQATLNAVRAMGDSYQQQTMKNAEEAAAAAASQETADKAGKEAKAPEGKAENKAKPAEPAPNPIADMAAAATAAVSMWPWKLMDSGTAAAKSAEAAAAKEKAAKAKPKKPATAAKAKAAPAARKTATTSRSTTPKR